MAGKVENVDNGWQQVELTHDGQSWCYPAKVKGSEWLLPMPFFLIDAWKAGDLTVKAL
jgi:hypothetical protein